LLPKTPKPHLLLCISILKENSLIFSFHKIILDLLKFEDLHKILIKSHFKKTDGRISFELAQIACRKKGVGDSRNKP
jgi:hypothetical protein